MNYVFILIKKIKSSKWINNRLFIYEILALLVHTCFKIKKHMYTGLIEITNIFKK